MRKINIVLGSILIIVSLLLAYQNRVLINEREYSRATMHWPKVGGTIPITNVSALNGRSIALGQVEENGRQAIFFFSSQCPACIRSMPYINEVAASCARLGIDFVGVTPEPDSESLRNFIKDSNIVFPVVANFDGRNMRTLNIRMTPTLLVVDSHGSINYVKVGSVESNKDAFDIVLGAMEKDGHVPTAGGEK